MAAENAAQAAEHLWHEDLLGKTNEEGEKGMWSSQVSTCSAWAARSLIPELPGSQEHKAFLLFLQKQNFAFFFQVCPVPQDTPALLSPYWAFPRHPSCRKNLPK